MIESGRSEITLQSFVLDLNELRGLVETMAAQFGDEPTSVDISVEQPTKHLRFSTVDELEAYKRLPARVRKVEVVVHGAGPHTRSLHVSFGGALFSASVRASGGADTWCRAATDGAKLFLDDHRAWHWWISRSRLWSLLLWATALSPISWVLLGHFPQTARLQMPAGILLGLFILLLLVSIAVAGEYLPPGTLEIAPDRVWYRRYAVELGLLIAVLALIAATIPLLR